MSLRQSDSPTFQVSSATFGPAGPALAPFADSFFPIADRRLNLSMTQHRASRQSSIPSPEAPCRSIATSAKTNQHHLPRVRKAVNEPLTDVQRNDSGCRYSRPRQNRFYSIERCKALLSRLKNSGVNDTGI